MEVFFSFVNYTFYLDKKEYKNRSMLISHFIDKELNKIQELIEVVISGKGAIRQRQKLNEEMRELEKERDNLSNANRTE
jgi:F420-dependent methylenetetrahydromethanopterin dehydrogenase